MKFDMKNKKLWMVVALILIAVISFALLADLFADPENHKASISYLDEKKETVMKLAASATAVSFVLAMVPGDATTPAANTLSDMTKYLLIVLAAVVLEKYLVTLSGLAVFKVLIPLACLLYAAYMIWAKGKLKQIASKLLVLSLALLLVVPVSVKVSGLIERTFDTSVEAAIEWSEEITAEAEQAEVEQTTTAEENSNASQSTTQEDGKDSDEGWFMSFFNAAKEFAGGAADKAGEAIDKVGDALQSIPNTLSIGREKVETALGNFIESIAVMLITSCLIPLAVLLFLVAVIKSILTPNAPLTMADLANFDKKIRHKSTSKVTGEKAEQEQLTESNAGQAALPKSK